MARNRQADRLLPVRKAFSPAELADKWSLSADTITRMFEREPGVLIFENPGRSPIRRRRTLRIPESVAERVYVRLTARK